MRPRLSHSAVIKPKGQEMLAEQNKGLVEQEIGRWLVGPAIAGSRHVSPGLDGFETALEHDPADSGGGTDDALVGKLVPDSPVAVTAAVALENALDFHADRFVGRLHGSGGGGVIVAAPGNAEGGADPSDALAGGLVDVADHFAKLGWGLVPRMTAAFFKMSFSWRRRAISRRRARGSSAAAFSPMARPPSLPPRAPCELLFHE